MFRRHKHPDLAETTSREDHQQRILEEFQEAEAVLEEARDLHEYSGHQLALAVTKHDDARRRLRAVAEGRI